MSQVTEEALQESTEDATPTVGKGEHFWRRLLRRGEAPAAEGLFRNVIAPHWPARAGNTIPLVTLAPAYRLGQHQVYVDLLERALRHPDTRSIALTGSYGSGKSSVLRALGHRWWDRRVTIELSLSTLDPELAPAVQAGNPAEGEMSNRIQKELVKQLLYRLPPGKTPRSRFPRAYKPTRPTGALVAAAAAAAVGLVWVMATLAGWQTTIADRLEEIGWSVQWFWIGVTAGSVSLAVLGWRTLAGKYALKAGLQAGALTVSLEPTSSSYFDQYLDEIMYFFQVSKTNVVLIEDVDRFGDAVVFDTLRALNTLVNSSGQIGRRVVFVYAIRDSVLGQIGAKDKDGKPHDTVPKPQGTALGFDRANRAKYFDVIIPIVPFITADNARDLMMQVMAPHVADTAEEDGISPALIRLAARHVADMRTLWSIRNEFEVHLDRLMTSARNVMPGINEDIVLSLVLLRATSPDSYEGIRLTTGPLDTLTKRWLAFVDANLDSQTENLTDLRTRLENGESRGARAERAGQELDSLRPVLLTMAAASNAYRVDFSDPLTESDLADLVGWQRIADGAPLAVTLWSKTTSTWGPREDSETVRLSPQLLSRLIGMAIDPRAWREADLEDLKRDIEKTEKEIAFLRHHTWEQLCARKDLTAHREPDEGDVNVVDDASATATNFASLVQTYAPTPLARDLILHGYLPRHFARYASMFYGEVVGLNAAEYISRAIEPGVPVPEYELDEQAIAQILSEQKADEDDADLFDDPSVYNLDIVRTLLEHRPGAARRVAAHLGRRWSAMEQSFVGRFFQRENLETAGKLAALMAPTWEKAVRFTTVDAPVSPETRLCLVDAVLSTISAEDRDDLDPEVGRYLSEHYAELPVLTDPPDAARATIVMKTVAAAGGTIRDLTKLEPSALAAITQVSVYPMTATNLQALGGADTTALDVLNSETKTSPIYEHALAYLTDYLAALAQLNPPGTPVKDPGKFATVLNAVADTGPESIMVDRFVEATSNSCRISDLDNVAFESWPALVTYERTDPTFPNVQLYIREYGLDERLARFISKQIGIATADNTPQSERLAVSSKILAARELIRTPATRVAVVTSIAPGVIPIEHINPLDANLVGPLLASHLLADEPQTFAPSLLKQWDELETAIAASQGFGDFSDSTTMPTRHLAQTLRSNTISGKTKMAIITKLPSLLTGASEAEATAITFALAERSEALDTPRIEALQAAGASNVSLVRMIVTQGEDLSIADLRAILLAMGSDYARAARGGSGTVRFNVDHDHEFLLDRLAGVTHTGAKEAHTKKHGTKLEANLKQPPP